MNFVGFVLVDRSSLNEADQETNRSSERDSESISYLPSREVIRSDGPVAPNRRREGVLFSTIEISGRFTLDL